MKTHHLTRIAIPAVALIAWLLAPQTAHCFYNTSTGRWISRDPLGEVGGKHLYGFVRNHPVKGVDRLGLEGLDSPSATLESAILRGDVSQVESILAGLEEGDPGYAAAQAFLKKVAQCEALWAAYKALKVNGCSDCVTSGEAAARAAIISAAIAG